MNKPIDPAELFSDSGQLWQHYCKAVARKSFNRATALAAWDQWLLAFVPDKRDRVAIPAPKLLQGPSGSFR
jgi:hypothetical protein